jgi:hypothetical protein
MKKETKELIEYMYDKFADRIAITRGLSAEQRKSAEVYNTQRDKIQKFLKSLPEIEEKLCFGGYIQDYNGTPCCHGDKVMYKNKEYTLQWSRPYSRFFLKADKSVRDIWDFGHHEILKMEDNNE